MSGLIYLAAGAVLPPVTAAILAVTTAILITGALHEDGLADVADGFGGGTSIPKKLEIMRDSRIGSYGVVALILTIGLIASAIATQKPTLSTLLIFATIGALSRAAIILPMVILPPARAEGLGHGAKATLDWRIWATLGLAACIALFSMPALLIPATLAAALTTWVAHRQIGGQTGDVLGATQKLSECACWLMIAAQINA
jgi:adenosylcobinamide-GDP ribazoletransferase